MRRTVKQQPSIRFQRLFHIPDDGDVILNVLQNINTENQIMGLILHRLYQILYLEPDPPLFDISPEIVTAGLDIILLYIDRQHLDIPESPEYKSVILSKSGSCIQKTPSAFISIQRTTQLSKLFPQVPTTQKQEIQGKIEETPQ